MEIWGKTRNLWDGLKAEIKGPNGAFSYSSGEKDWAVAYRRLLCGSVGTGGEATHPIRR